MDNQIQEIRVIGMSPQQLERMILEAAQMVVEKTNAIKKLEELPENLTKKQVAEFYQVSLQTVVNWENQGTIKRYPLNGTDIFRYKKNEVLAIRENKK